MHCLPDPSPNLQKFRELPIQTPSQRAMTARRGWPVVESRLGLPFAVWGAVYSILCILVMIPLVVLLQADIVDDIPTRISLTALGGFFLLIALLAGSATIWNWMKNPPFLHADPSVLPDVPREPLLSSGQLSFSIITHQLELTATGFRLSPIPGFIRRAAWFLSFWITVMLAIVITIIWGPPIEFSTSVPLRIGFTGFSVLVTLMMIGLIHWMWDRAASGLATLIFDATSNTCRIDREQESITIPASDVAAIQLCAARRRTADRDGEVTLYFAVELNLVWQDSDPPTSAATTWERATLMNHNGPAYQLVPIATKLADQLQVPLLNHATPEHWKWERQRSKTRPAETGGGHM